MKYDLIISGAGCIGLTFACLMAKSGLSVAVLNNTDIYARNVLGIGKKRGHDNKRFGVYNPPEILGQLPSRLFAIAAASLDIFEKAGILEVLKEHAQPINKILIGDHNNHEQLIFDPKEIGRDDFGCMLDERIIAKALIAEVQRHQNITLYKNVEINSIIYSPHHNQLHLSDGTTLLCDLLLVSEGKHSKTRKILGIETKNINYNQDVIICDIEHEVDHRGVAVERLLTTGPFAVLPRVGGHKSGIIITGSGGTGRLLASKSGRDIEYIVKERLGDCLGDIKLASSIAYFTLHLIYAKKYTESRAALCGDAMHSIHPIAGQGLNLGLRDIQLLAQLINENISLGLDIGSKRMLSRYSLQRDFDINLMISSTHNINGIFASDFLPIQLLRRAGIQIIKNVSPLKKYVMSYASGYKY
ncbi:FAD-dependent monooxygenase [Candidatus Bandiella euplotis]|uniref:Ubiquinone biosynthesis hydroxylase, UbiH/UbiF/VisC/CoxQ family n=1 Tax=Candidatus Bandiella euplotis TaxID=1664265 RepID=A0ABZ0US24_9RICK|nr:FAD-dependent monooxygenase [Candidatus Bandiella woodruffii]WPX96860.1 Ubiquinone biosynthesis hydroxylase, UbiH/UbiF/VisC/CoxQ family [Candidatus Bandiella woodruffii]